MVFAYYKRLNRKQKEIYRKSDVIGIVRLPEVRRLQQIIMKLAMALKQQNRVATETACRTLAAGMMRHLNVAPVRVTVLVSRPHNDFGELHGLYQPAEDRKQAHITVWMRTAKRRQVVAFRTFLRTLLHEICHHLDYVLLGLEDSFHTEGFYRRESSLFHQLVPDSK